MKALPSPVPPVGTASRTAYLLPEPTTAMFAGSVLPIALGFQIHLQDPNTERKSLAIAEGYAFRYGRRLRHRRSPPPRGVPERRRAASVTALSVSSRLHVGRS